MRIVILVTRHSRFHNDVCAYRLRKNDGRTDVRYARVGYVRRHPPSKNRRTKKRYNILKCSWRVHEAREIEQQNKRRKKTACMPITSFGSITHHHPFRRSSNVIETPVSCSTCTIQRICKASFAEASRTFQLWEVIMVKLLKSAMLDTHG